MDNPLSEKPVFFEYAAFPERLSTVQMAGIVREGVVNPGTDDEYVYFFLQTSIGPYLINEYFADDKPTINPGLSGPQAQQLMGARAFIECQTAGLEGYELHNRGVYAKASPKILQVLRIKKIRVDPNFAPLVRP